MNDKRFLQYLVNCGSLDDKVIFDAMNLQKKRRMAFGRVALEEKLLTVKQVLTILDEQIDTPKLFGEIAIDLGYLTEKDVLRILEIREERIPRIENILVEMGQISRNELDYLMEKYQKEVSQSSPCSLGSDQAEAFI